MGEESGEPTRTGSQRLRFQVWCCHCLAVLPCTIVLPLLNLAFHLSHKEFASHLFLSAIFSSLIKPLGQFSLKFSDICFLSPRRVQAQDGLWVRDKSPMCPWLQFAVLWTWWQCPSACLPPIPQAASGSIRQWLKTKTPDLGSSLKSPVTNCGIWGKLLNSSELQGPHLGNGGNCRACRAKTLRAILNINSENEWKSKA